MGPKFIGPDGQQYKNTYFFSGKKGKAEKRKEKRESLN